MKVSELVQEVKDLYPNIRPSTFKTWDKATKPIIDFDVESIDKRTVRKLRVQLLQELGESTVVARLTTLRGIWEKAIEWEMIEGKNVFNKSHHGLEKANRADAAVFRPWEFWEPYHEHPWFRILWYTGCRIHEVAALNPNNIVMNTDIPYIKFEHQPNRLLKNNASVRKVPLHPSCWDYVERFKPCKAKENHGHRWSWTMGCRVGLPNGHAAHDLRHAFTTQCRDVGIEEYMIDILTGHAKRSMTARYGQTHFHLLRDQLYKFEEH